MASGVVATVTTGLAAQATGDVPIGVVGAVAATPGGSNLPLSATGGAIHLVPLVVALTGLSCSPGLLPPNTNAACIVTLNVPATVAAHIPLSSDTPSLMKVPAHDSYPAGSPGAAFAAEASKFTGSARITASWQGAAFSITLAVQ